MRDTENPNMMQHLTIDQMTQLWGNLGTTIAFVRNPFDRLVSLFHHLGQTAETRLKLRLKEDRPAFKVIPVESDVRIYNVYRKGFGAWVKSSEPRNTDCPLMYALTSMREHSQLRFLSYKIPDIVVRLENVDQEFSKIQDVVGCHTSFIHINKSKRSSYQDYYDTESQQIVTSWFKDDLEAFNYQF